VDRSLLLSSRKALLAELAEVLLADDRATLFQRGVVWFARTLELDRALIVVPDVDSEQHVVAADTDPDGALSQALRGAATWSPISTAWPVEFVPVAASVRADLAAAGYTGLVIAHLAGRRGEAGAIVGFVREPWSCTVEDGCSSDLIALAVTCGVQIGAAVDRQHDRDALLRETILHRVIALADENQPLEQVLQTALEITLTHPGLAMEAYGALFLTTPDDALRMVAKVALSPAVLRDCALVKSGRCLCGRVLQSGVRLVKAHVDCDHELGDPNGGRDHGHVILPLRSDSGLYGVLTLYTASGHKVALATLANLEHVAAAIARLIERVRLRAQLAQQARTFQALLDHAPIIAAVHRNGRFVYANTSMAESLGYPDAAALVGKAVVSIVHPEDRAMVAERVAAMTRDGLVAPLAEERYVHADGSTIYADTVAMPVEFDGEPSVFVMAQDVTDRKAVRARSALADRLASLGQLAAMIGHDINNPLTYVKSNLEYALTALETEPEATRDALHDAIQGAEFIARVTSDLRTYVRDGAVTGLVSVRVADAVTFVTRMAAARFRSAAQVAVDVESDLQVLGEPSRVAQVIMNLVLNAVQAVEGSDSTSVVVSARREGDVAVIAVQDWGPGMTEDQVASAFRPFVTSKSDGTGLGLYITRTIVEELGGWVELQSKRGVGTTVRVRLPVAVGAPVDSLGDEEDLALHDRRVLIIDDDELVLRSMTRLFSDHFRVVGAVGGFDGLAKLRATVKPFDLILCDVMMPNFDGPALYNALHAAGLEQAQGRFVFMTGGVFTPETAAFMQGSTRPLLFKPVLLGDVLRELAKVPKVS